MRAGSDVDARLAAADAWLAAGLSSALQPALRDGTSLRGLKAICEIAFFVATRLRRYDQILVQAVDDCLSAEPGGRADPVVRIRHGAEVDREECAHARQAGQYRPAIDLATPGVPPHLRVSNC